MHFVFITGGVSSSLGKGIASAALGSAARRGRVTCGTLKTFATQRIETINAWLGENQCTIRVGEHIGCDSVVGTHLLK